MSLALVDTPYGVTCVLAIVCFDGRIVIVCREISVSTKSEKGEARKKASNHKYRSPSDDILVALIYIVDILLKFIQIIFFVHNSAFLETITIKTTFTVFYHSLLLHETAILSVFP